MGELVINDMRVTSVRGNATDGTTSFDLESENFDVIFKITSGDKNELPKDFKLQGNQRYKLTLEILED